MIGAGWEADGGPVLRGFPDPVVIMDRASHQDMVAAVHADAGFCVEILARDGTP